MLNAILRRTLVWSLPLAAAYLYLLSVYGRPGKSSLAVAARSGAIAAPCCERSERVSTSSLGKSGYSAAW